MSVGRQTAQPVLRVFLKGRSSERLKIKSFGKDALCFIKTCLKNSFCLNSCGGQWVRWSITAPQWLGEEGAKIKWNCDTERFEGGGEWVRNCEEVMHL